jgi:hypothetical protein
MQFAFGSNIGLMRFFWRIEQTYAYRFVIDLYFRQPFAVFFPYAQKSAFSATASPVLRVFHVRDFAQIMQRIMSAVSIQMVYLIQRPFTVNMQPDQPMREIQRIIKTDTNVSSLHLAPHYSAATTPASCNRPSEQTRCWVVIKEFAQSVRGHANNINFVLCGSQV